LLSTNHKCTQPCYFSLLLKPAAQKEMMDWNSSTKSSRLCVAPVAVPVVLWSLPLFCSTESRLSFKDIIYVINMPYTMTMVSCEHFWSYVWNIWSWVMHMMSTQFWHKNRVWHCVYEREKAYWNKMVKGHLACSPAGCCSKSWKSSYWRFSKSSAPNDSDQKQAITNK
jgi:hypothetical protein